MTTQTMRPTEVRAANAAALAAGRPLDALRHTLDYFILRNPAPSDAHNLAVGLAREFEATVHAGPQGTMRSWLTERAQRQLVHTVQVHADGNAWAPGPRDVTTHATYAKFDGSRRYYAGCRVLAASMTALIVHDTTANSVILYTNAIDF